MLTTCHRRAARDLRRLSLKLAMHAMLVIQPTWLAAAPGPDKANAPVQALRSGVNAVPLQAGAPAGMAGVALRENFHAHGFEVLTLYAQLGVRSSEAPRWQIVPVFDATGEHLVVTASGGADCMLHDFRLLKPAKGRDAELILADREMGDGFASQAQVVFRFFSLRNNREGIPGRPALYFELVRTQPAQAPYCDVGAALETELGLPKSPRR